MGKNTFTQILEEMSGKVALFESSLEVDEFLKDAISLLMAQVEASLGAVFIYDGSYREKRL